MELFQSPAYGEMRQKGVICMADVFPTYITHNANGSNAYLSYSISNQTVSRAIIAAAEAIKNVIKEENPDACTYDACCFIAKKTADYFGSQQLQ